MGAADAVMLDVDGFVSETNAEDIFMVKEGKLATPCKGSSCLPGIPRFAFTKSRSNVHKVLETSTR